MNHFFIFSIFQICFQTIIGIIKGHNKRKIWHEKMARESAKSLFLHSLEWPVLSVNNMNSRTRIAHISSLKFALRFRYATYLEEISSTTSDNVVNAAKTCAGTAKRFAVKHCNYTQVLRPPANNIITE